MRVNITYSVGLENIPEEISKLLLEGSESLKESTKVVDSMRERSPLEMVESINSIRETMAIFDMRLAECLAILSGYIDVKGKVAAATLSAETNVDYDDDELGGIDE